MRRFKNIMVVCDDPESDEALFKRAALIAKSNEAKVCLASTLEAEAGELSRLLSGLPGIRSHDAELALVDYRRSQLQESVKTFEREGIETSTRVLKGTPFIEITKQVFRGEHDLLLKTASGRPNGYRRLFASVDLHLLRKCPCPVWIMQPSMRLGYDRILAAIDPDPDNPDRDAISRLVMDLATSLKTIDKGTLHVLHVWHLYGEEAMRSSAMTKIPKAQIDAMAEEQQAKSQTKLDRLMSSYADRLEDSQVHLIKGEAPEVVPTFAREQDVDVVVMGTVGRTGVQGLLIGNTAETVLNEVTCSVLAVKPPGFASPIRP